MTSGKVDQALARELDRLAATGAGDSRVPVLIEHVDPDDDTADDAGQDGERRAKLDSHAYALQGGIVERLRELGVAATPRQLLLANAITVELTPDQVSAVATHPDVKRIHLAGLERAGT